METDYKWIWYREKRTLKGKKLEAINRHMNRCSTSPAIREMPIKTTMSYHLTPVRMAITKKFYKQFERIWRKGNPPTLLVEM